MNHCLEHHAKGVGKDMALAPFDLLAGITTSWAAVFRSFDRLAVDGAGTRTGLTAFEFADQHDEGVVARAVSRRL